MQACRRAYTVKDEETGDELKVENKYIMSPKDLSTIMFIDKIIESGASILKIEGRGRAPEYVYTTVSTYKKAINDYKNNKLTMIKKSLYKDELKKVFNRGFWEGGYYLGKKLGEWTDSYGSKAQENKKFLGNVINYYQKINVAEIKINADDLSVGDEIYIIGSTTGVLRKKISEIHLDKKKIKTAVKGNVITLVIKEKLRTSDEIYKIKNF